MENEAQGISISICELNFLLFKQNECLLIELTNMLTDLPKVKFFSKMKRIENFDTCWDLKLKVGIEKSRKYFEFRTHFNKKWILLFW